MGTGQIHKELYEQKIWEQIKMITDLEEQGLWNHIDTALIRHILLDSIKFYYE